MTDLPDYNKVNRKWCKEFLIWVTENKNEFWPILSQCSISVPHPRNYEKTFWFYAVFSRHTMEHFLNMHYGEKEGKSMKSCYLFCHSRTNMRHALPIPVYSGKIRPGHKRWIKKIYIERILTVISSVYPRSPWCNYIKLVKY